MSPLLALYNHATVKAAHAATQRAETIHLTAAEMSAGEFKDYRMYEYNSLEFFPAYNQLWNLSTDGRFRSLSSRIVEGNRGGWSTVNGTQLSLSHDRPLRPH